ncbi:unnamed protein product [Rotaria socialis]|uniref:Uncharacterized protein n=1 Tax=Rotaria socialis TaxID=392032 RepID=A0A817T8Y9_9BILA|nr:unnamed protein product [Rotaria socialis]CAF4403670.1 unnamed protein product [Rotaria socialis]
MTKSISLFIILGDFAIVKYFVTKYPATKRQTNKAGLTALQIAQKLKFTRIAELIVTGKDVPESLIDEDNAEPKHSYETLKQASRDGKVKIIKEFIKERYESKEDKRRLCYELIQIAKKVPQYEIVDILEPYYKKELRTEIASDMEVGSAVTLNSHYKKILLGFLSGLSSVIADSPVVLDPSDPNTYRDLFSDLTSNVRKRSQELQQVTDEQDVKKLIAQDSANTEQQLIKINETLEQLLENKESLQARIEDTEGRVFKQQDLTALQRKELIQQREAHKQQLATYECSIFLFQRQQEAMLIRQNMMKFIKGNTNMTLFYRTIENRLQALFVSILAAQGGHVKRETATVNTMSATIPFANLVISHIKSALIPTLSKLNEKEQKQAWANISTLGNFEELQRIASDTAGMVTLYYREQIQSIDPFQKIKSSYVFNYKIKWIKEIFYDARSESNEEMAVTMVAEYVTAWIIDALKAGKTEIDTFESLPQQLWLHIAKKNTVDQEATTKATDVVEHSAGKQKIPVKFRNSLDKEYTVQVPLRYLIGCVSVFGNNGSIYQCPIAKISSNTELHDLEIFRYVYVAPFSSDEKVFQSIVDERKLHVAGYDNLGNILTRFEDIIEHAQAYVSGNDEHASKSLITKETANQVAEVLREQKIFVDAKDVKGELKRAQETIELSIDVLRENIQEQTNFYETSIKAAHEQIKLESITNREEMKKDNEMHYDQGWKKLNEKLKDIEKHLSQQIEKRVNDIEQEMREKTKEIITIAETANAQSFQATRHATQATQISEKLAQDAAQAAVSVQNLVESTEQRRQELQLTANQCETTVKQTVATQKEFYERMILEMRTKLERDVERAKEAARESAATAKESARAAQESASYAQEVQKITKNQLEVQRRETEKILADVKEMRQQNERAVHDAREAEKQAKRAADVGTTALEKVEKLTRKV